MYFDFISRYMAFLYAPAPISAPLERGRHRRFLHNNKKKLSFFSFFLLKIWSVLKNLLPLR